MKLQYTDFPAYCLANGLPEPIKEFVFHAGRKWRFDWAFPEKLVALEIEGGIWKGKPCPVCGLRRGGRHNSGTGMIKDMEKYNAAAVAGWRIIRCVPAEFESGAVIDILRKVF